ncbi:hypothetical protein EVU91_01340 [Macrococcoides bohemicum]|uniref:hypothetical protein n=1 Tax=Macrococcoides bohemicum TaxID=1903056 RepID=UPI00105A2843|nr:hypothetical protein [Macrococcus bohemicus]TDL40562.1 hypothetical protein EVU91_01340 [Macrococcus bohemicus]
MEKVKPTIIKPEGMTFEELIVAYEKKCSMWNELKEKFQNSSQPFKVDLTKWDVLNVMKQLKKEIVG